MRIFGLSTRQLLEEIRAKGRIERLSIIEAADTCSDLAMVEKITKALSLNLPAYVLRSKDPRAVLTSLVNAWIPLSTALLVTVIEQLPSPRAAQGLRTSDLLDASPGHEHLDPRIRAAMQGLKVDRSEPTVAFVSKMVSVPLSDLPENKTRSGNMLTADEAREMGRKKRAEIARAQAATNGQRTDVAELREALSEASIGKESNGEAVPEEEAQDSGERLIGFARLFSGTLEVGDELYVLNPKFNPADPHRAPEPQKITITALYLLMGRGLEPLTSVPAGVVFGVAGLEGHIMKSGTLCSQLEGGVNLAGLSMGSQPIVRVALEPENPADLGKMVTGLKLLQQSDPCAAYEILDNGEHVILTAGEVHLERCLKDLRERFARCEIQVGAPIVPYRESIVSAAEMNLPRDKDLPRGTVISTLGSRQITIRLRVRPLPSDVTTYLMDSAPMIRELYAEHAEADDEDKDKDDDEEEELETDNAKPSTNDARSRQTLNQIAKGLEASFAAIKGSRDSWKGLADKVVAFGPRRSGANLLIDATPDQACKDM